MNYDEGYKHNKGRNNAAFYIIIAVCLVLIGGIAWFAATRFNTRESGMESSMKSDVESRVSSVRDKTESVISKAESGVSSFVSSAVGAGKQVESEPYTSSQKTPSENVSSVKPKAPVYTMPVEGEVIKDYNERQLQYSATYGDMRLHMGIDIACENGTSVSACADGKIASVDESADYGKVVTIDHGNGITAKYAALSDVKFKAGDKVSAGDIIGVTVSVPSECADQSHLHFEVYKNGHAAEPKSVLGIDG